MTGNNDNDYGAKALSIDLERVVDNPYLADTEFLVGPEREPVYAVSAVLACRSPYFERLLFGAFREASTDAASRSSAGGGDREGSTHDDGGGDASAPPSVGTDGGRVRALKLVEMPDDDPAVFRMALSFACTGRLDTETPSAAVVPLVLCAERLVLPGLRAACLELVVGRLAADAAEALPWLAACRAAGALGPTVEIELACIRRVCEPAAAFALLPSSAFAQLPDACAARVLGCDALCVPEAYVLEAVCLRTAVLQVGGAIADADGGATNGTGEMDRTSGSNRTDLACVRWGLLTPSQLYQLAEPSGLATPLQLAEAYRHNVDPSLFPEASPNGARKPRCRRGIANIRLPFFGLRALLHRAAASDTETMVSSAEYDLAQGFSWRVHLSARRCSSKGGEEQPQQEQPQQEQPQPQPQASRTIRFDLEICGIAAADGDCAGWIVDVSGLDVKLRIGSCKKRLRVEEPARCGADGCFHFSLDTGIDTHHLSDGRTVVGLEFPSGYLVRRAGETVG